MAKNLLIVESPAKAKTIEKILGKDFTVKSSMGHVRDLVKKDKSVDIDNGFAPKYEVPSDKKKIVKELKDWVKKVDEVWLATDEDREGEAISWHLCKVLGLDEQNTKRIVFREITKPAILKAVKEPRNLDLNLVNAQQARRVLDRLVGYELSELLWKKVRGKLSAGRVQSVAVKLIVDREREIQQFKPDAFFKIQAFFNVQNTKKKTVSLRAESPSRIGNVSEAESLLKSCISASFTIRGIDVRPIKRKPAPPFTTSTLQQEASRKLGFSVNRTMRVAQKLYESGLITYMRTDSISLSEVALQTIRQAIESNYGQNYHQLRRYKSKKSNAQEAHEAIRPTYIDRINVSPDRDEQRLYDLIWKRTIACQMADAQLEKTIASIAVSTLPDFPLQAEGQVLKFDGFLKVYLEGKDDDDDDDVKGVLPPLHIGQVLPLREMEASERFTKPKPRYTEASLVKKLEELGIGRPSTYAPTISKIMEENRGYIVKGISEGQNRTVRKLHLDNEENPPLITSREHMEKYGSDKGRLVPTDTGMIVSDFLSKHFTDIMTYNFTADIEKKFDTIASGQLNWAKMLEVFYGPFHNTVEATLATAERASGERILGIDPKTGKTMLVRLSRLGRPVVQIGKPEELAEDEKPQYANLRPNQTLETITFEEAKDLFQLPKSLGTYQGKEMIVGIGPYGPYVRHNEKYISLPRGEDPLEVNAERAVALIQAKQKEDAPLFTYQGIPVTRGKGRFGPFLKWDKLYVNIPKKYDPDSLSVADATMLLEKKIEKEANRFIRKWDAEQIAIENGRWGPFIRFKKKNVSIPKKEDGKRVTQDEAAEMDLEEVIAIINTAIPGAIKPKKTKKKK